MTQQFVLLLCVATCAAVHVPPDWPHPAGGAPTATCACLLADPFPLQVRVYVVVVVSAPVERVPLVATPPMIGEMVQDEALLLAQLRVELPLYATDAGEALKLPMLGAGVCAGVVPPPPVLPPPVAGVVDPDDELEFEGLEPVGACEEVGVGVVELLPVPSVSVPGPWLDVFAGFVILVELSVMGAPPTPFRVTNPTPIINAMPAQATIRLIVTIFLNIMTLKTPHRE
jgi:hypothetical protein